MRHERHDLNQRIWHWRECQDCRDQMIGTWQRQAPREPEGGQGRVSEQDNCLFVWDGEEWVCVPSD